jgi:hypothetical protein
MTRWLLEGARGLAFVLEVNILGLGFAAVGLLTAAVVVLPFTLGAAAWEARDRTSFKRWGAGGGDDPGLVCAALSSD